MSFLASSFFSTFYANIFTGSLTGASTFFSTAFTSYFATGVGFESAALVSAGLTDSFFSACYGAFSNPRILFVFHSGCALASLKSKSNHSD